MQNYNNELVKCIEDLKEKREEVSVKKAQTHQHQPLHIHRNPPPLLRAKQRKHIISPRSTAAPRQPYLLIASRAQVNRQIVKDEEEKAKIQNDLRMLTERLSRVNDSVARKVASRNE